MKTNTPPHFISAWRGAWNTFLAAVVLLLGFTFAPTARAQWTTQTITLKPGWNAVFLHVDVFQTTLDASVGADPANPISEIWLWQPVLAPGRFINNPEQPTVVNNDWALWNRTNSTYGVLTRLLGNNAYLVRNTSAAPYVWTIFGSPVPPRYTWTAQGVNFLGFSTPEVNPPVVDTFFSPVPALQNLAEFFYYPGNEAPGAPPTTAQLFTRFSTRLTRGQAFWIRAGNLYNNYFGPLQVIPQNADGIHFNTDLGQFSLRIRNLTASTIFVTNSVLPSLPAPSGFVPIVGTPPLLLRGDLNVTNQVFAFSDFSAPRVITLAPQGQPGSSVEVVIGLNRTAMTNAPNAPGDIYAGIFRLTDSLGYSQIDLPVTAVKTSTRGLWIGNALVSQVRQYLKAYQKDASGQPVVGAINSTGAPYVITNIDTSIGPTAAAFPLRLIIHVDTNDTVRLLQRVYTGFDLNTNVVLTLNESQLDPKQLGSARRISAAHLPWTPTNQVWAFAGSFQLGQTLTNTITVNYNDHASNPFLHTYHPDHDNLNALFNAIQPIGVESYGVKRQIVLTLTPPDTDYTSLTTGSTIVNGTYQEDITFIGRSYVIGPMTTNESKTISTSGSFRLNRISPVSTLTMP